MARQILLIVVEVELSGGRNLDCKEKSAEVKEVSGQPGSYDTAARCTIIPVFISEFPGQRREPFL